MNDNVYRLIRDTAVSAAKCAGSLQKQRFQKNVEIFSDSHNDITTMVDRECSDIIASHIGSVFPDHSILCEEASYVSGGSEYEWVIDPLDGSVNYFLGLPYYCVSIACYHKSAAMEAGGDGRNSVFGVVYAPSTDELFTGSETEGAYYNGKRIIVSKSRRLGEGILGLSLGSKAEIFSAVHAFLPAVFEEAKKVRSLGATALDLCRVAAGGLTGLFQIGVKLWDFAAARIILECAGGCFDSREDAPGCYTIIAGNKASMPEMEVLFRWKTGVMS